MKKLALALATSALFSASAFAAPMYIQLPDNSYDTGRFIGAPDADTRTANFNLFGFTDIWATSVYDLSDGSLFGSFYDTNIEAELAAAGVPAAGLALDGVTPVSLVLPDYATGQADLDALSPLAPPLATNNEGFLQTWDFQVRYHFDGVLNAAGPKYTGGTFDIIFNDFNNDANDRTVISGNLLGSNIAGPNLELFFEVSFAELGFLFIQDSNGDFRDAATSYTTFRVDTNVDPAIPTADQLLVVGTNAIRQTSLDGSITAEIPEPATLALLGMGLLGFAFSRRGNKQA